MTGNWARKMLFVSALAVLSLMVALSMFGNISAAQTPKRGGTLRVGASSEIKALDPHVTTLAIFNATLRYTVFETLVEVGKDLKFVPQLAASWSFPNDLTMKINLRKRVKFHDGSEMTSEDVKFTFDRIMDKKFGSPFLPQLGTVKSVEAPDRYSVILNLNAPSPAILTCLSYIQIVGKKSIGQIDKHPIGTGPFEFVEWVLNDRLVLKKFTNYWQSGKPYLDKIVFTPVTDSDARLSNLRAGAFDMIQDPNYKDISLIEKDPKLQMFATTAGSGFNCVQLNCEKPPTNDPRIRKAIAYSMDREAIVRDIYYGYARVSAGPFSPLNWAYNSVLDNTFKYDLKKAAALIAEAGYPGGKGLELEILQLIGFKPAEAGAVMLQQALNSIGVKCTIKKLDVAAWIDYHITNSNYQINFNGYSYGGVADPSAVFNQDNLAPAFNGPRYYNKEYEELVMKGQTTVDQQERKKIYQRLQEKLAEDMPMFLICHTSVVAAARKGVHGYDPGVSVRYMFTDTWME